MREIFSYLKKYTGQIIGQLVFATLWVLSQLAVPRLMVDIIDLGIAGGDFAAVINRGLFMLLATVLNVAFLVTNVYFLTQTTSGVARDLRHDLFSKIINLSPASRQKFSDSSLTTRTINDVKQISNFFDLLFRKIYTLTITVLGAVIISFTLDWQLALIILVIIPIIVVLTISLTTSALPQYSRIRKSLDKLNLDFSENISGIRVIKAFNKTDYEKNEFKANVEASYEADVKAESTMLLLNPLVLLFSNILILFILYFAAQRIADKTIPLGTMIAIIEYAGISLNNIRSFAKIITVIPRSKVSIERVEEILNLEEVIPAGKYEHCPADPAEAGNISLNAVDFSYGASQVKALSDISLSLKKGETKAIIGSTGSGKSTVLRMIMRDYLPESGSVKLNGIDTVDLSNNAIQEAITYVPQATILLSGTVRDNFKIIKPQVSDEEIWQALEICQMADFFKESETGLDTYIAQGAVNLSGGQKQRISIARALVRDTDFYLFDDCFSALDYKTKRSVINGLKTKLKDKGILIVAQRAANIAEADEIFVLENGQIESQGTHAYLSKHSQIYQEILASQSEENVAG